MSVEGKEYVVEDGGVIVIGATNRVDFNVPMNAKAKKPITTNNKKERRFSASSLCRYEKVTCFHLICTSVKCYKRPAYIPSRSFVNGIFVNKIVFFDGFFSDKFTLLFEVMC
ncbi:hypothetical protein N9Y26_01430 [bacterium]|nr:hypothetical protein [bacterium]